MTPRNMTDSQVEHGLELLVELTEEIADLQERMTKAGKTRRAMMLRLNRRGGVSYRRIAEVAGLAISRVISEMGRAREEAGIEGELHPWFGKREKVAVNGHGE